MLKIVVGRLGRTGMQKRLEVIIGDLGQLFNIADDDYISTAGLGKLRQ